ncbi:MAG: Ig domain-containing protein [Balneolales bacterium]|nr:Ig domain-containing protein [Balneolales bacterium]
MKALFLLLSLITLSQFLSPLYSCNQAFARYAGIAVNNDRSDFQKDLRHLMEIPGLQAIAASETHLYALSSEEGLVVFRVHADSLQWLYTSQGMQRRGNTISADVRFAYLTGNGNQLTIVEPTSVLGVYSSTTLPSRPLSAARSGNWLYLGTDNPGLYRISLETPESVDQTPEAVATSIIGRNRVYSVKTRDDNILVLTSNNRLHQFRQNGSDLEHIQSFTFGPAVARLFLADDQPLIAGAEGTVYELSSEGELNPVLEADAAVDQVFYWNGTYFARTIEGRVFIGDKSRTSRIYRRDTRANNFMALTKNQLWISEYNQLTQLMLKAPETASSTAQESGRSGSVIETLRLTPISNLIVPFPRPVILPIQFEEPITAENVRFQIRSGIQDAVIRDQGFYWQPASRNVGSNHFTIIASTSDGQVDSTSFNIEVRAFNAPPRFNPVRPLSIPVGETFTLPLRATDPDGPDPQLIRYLGMDLPEGASINEFTGELNWVPTRRQTGEHQFQVIATDQFGAASSITITVNVMQLSRNN